LDGSEQGVTAGEEVGFGLVGIDVDGDAETTDELGEQSADHSATAIWIGAGRCGRHTCSRQASAWCRQLPQEATPRIGHGRVFRPSNDHAIESAEVRHQP